MFKFGMGRERVKYSQRVKGIDPDEIFIDSSNLPNFDIYQFEGRLEKSIPRQTLAILGVVLGLIFLLFLGRIWMLQVKDGNNYFSKSENNRLRNSLIFAKRGIIYDRTGMELAWNVENIKDPEFSLRKYIPLDGFAHLLGYLKYPSKDKFGFYFSEIFDGKAGVEKYYNNHLAGTNGKQIVEVNALGEIQSENIIHTPTDGENLTLSVDAALQNKLQLEIKSLAERVDFTGGAGIIMDVKSGEVIAMTSYPEYSPQILTDGNNTSQINAFLVSKGNPFLDRVIDGLYTPGSTIKPYMALAALMENIIDPQQNILSTGSISLPNPYDETKPSIFRDWKAHGYVDMRKALAVSSDVYFYEIGGGFESQPGLGIAKIEKYMRLFGFGSMVPVVSASTTDPNFSLFFGPDGEIPTPEWKAEHFNGEDWRVGNTYHTSIGQYGFSVSPLQLVRAVSALANGGNLLTPTILSQDKNTVEKNRPIVSLQLETEDLEIIREGMHDGVIKEYGVARGLYSLDYNVAAKTGTAELGSYKQYVNSWVSGFWPYDNPQYAFVVIMEKGPVANTMGATSVIRQVMDWMVINKPEYLY